MGGKRVKQGDRPQTGTSFVADFSSRSLVVPNKLINWKMHPAQTVRMQHMILSPLNMRLRGLKCFLKFIFWEVVRSYVCCEGGQGYPWFGCRDFIRSNKHKISLSSPLSGTDSVRSSGQTAWICNWQPALATSANFTLCNIQQYIAPHILLCWAFPTYFSSTVCVFCLYLHLHHSFLNPNAMNTFHGAATR